MVLLEFSDLQNICPLRSRRRNNASVQDWFPLCHSPTLAGIVADLMGDGHLQSGRHWQIFFTSKSKSELLRFEQTVFSLFKIKGKIYPCTTNKYFTMNYAICCAPLARVLSLIGVPTGEKVSKDYSIPIWIANDKECFRRFVQRYFDCEGSVEANFGYIQVKLYKTKPFLESGFGFMKQVQNGLLNYFGIITSNPFLGGGKSIRKDGTTSYEIALKIKRKSALYEFNEQIGFETPHKSERLAKAIQARTG